MMRFAMVALLLVGSAVAQTPATSISKAFTPLQGTWVLTSPDGQSVMPGAELALVITGDSYSQTVNGESTERGTIKLDSSKKPMAIDLIITEGDDAGKTQLGLIEVTGDTMKGALNVPGGAERPTGLAAGGAAITFVGKRKPR